MNENAINIDNADKIIEIIEKKISNTNILIGIDGFDGVGKSDFLGKKLIEKFNIKYIEIDKNYRIKDTKKFIESVKNEHLKTAIETFKKNGSVIIDSICLLNVLDNIGIKCDLLIYVKRFWHEEYEKYIKNNKNINEILLEMNDEQNEFHKLNNKLSKIKKFNLNDYLLVKEIILYHKKYKPHQVADIIFNNEF